MYFALVFVRRRQGRKEPIANNTNEVQEEKSVIKLLRMKCTARSAAAICLLGASGLAQATVYNVLDVLAGSSGFGASVFHDSSGSNPQTGTVLSNFTGNTVSGTYDDVSGLLNVTIALDGTDGTFDLNGSLVFDASGKLNDNSQLSLAFSDPISASALHLHDDELGFQPGYVCCGSSDQDPNSFIASGSNQIMTLWGANYGGGTFTGDYGPNPPRDLGMDLRLKLTAVPVPAAAWLFGSGLLGLAGVVRRKKTT